MHRSHQVTTNAEEVADESMHGQESLCLPGRFEPAHLSLALPCGLVGDFGAIVLVSVRAMGDGRHDRWRWCTNRNWHATVPTTGASSPDGVGSWAAHVGHRIQHLARELRFDRSPTGCPGSKTIADDRRIPEEGVLDSRLLIVA